MLSRLGTRHGQSEPLRHPPIIGRMATPLVMNNSGGSSSRKGSMIPEEPGLLPSSYWNCRDGCSSVNLGGQMRHTSNVVRGIRGGPLALIDATCGAVTSQGGGCGRRQQGKGSRIEGLLIFFVLVKQRRRVWPHGADAHVPRRGPPPSSVVAPGVASASLFATPRVSEGSSKPSLSLPPPGSALTSASVLSPAVWSFRTAGGFSAFAPGGRSPIPGQLILAAPASPSVARGSRAVTPRGGGAIAEKTTRPSPARTGRGKDYAKCRFFRLCCQCQLWPHPAGGRCHALSQFRGAPNVRLP